MVDAAQIAGLNCLRLMNETTAGLYWVFLGRARARLCMFDCCSECGWHSDLT